MPFFLGLLRALLCTHRQSWTHLIGQSLDEDKCLLRNLVIDRPNQVWAEDINSLPMARGFVYLVAIMDWYSRKVLSWRLSNTLDASFCIAALEEAIETHGVPEIFNTDQGSQSTSEDLTGDHEQHGIRISMDGKGRWVCNVFVERLWRIVKDEEDFTMIVQPLVSGSKLESSR